MQPVESAAERKEVPTIRTSGLLAEYTLGQTPTGEWFALGSVRGERDDLKSPAWLIVGTGASPEDAVAGLRLSLAREAESITTR